MSHRSVPSGSGYISVSLERAQGKALRSLDVYQTDDTLNVNLLFDQDIAVELRFVVGLKASATLLQYEEGNAHVIKGLGLKSLK